MNIRKFVLKAARLNDLVRLGSMPPQAARFLEAAVLAGQNIVVAGGTQAGKRAGRCRGRCAPYCLSEPTGYRVYPPGERPDDVEVRVGEDWLPADFRSWSSSPSSWWANCSWHRAAGETQLGTAPGLDLDCQATAV